MLEPELLLTPGPTHTPERLFKAMQRPTVHHRTPEFQQVFFETLGLYQRFIDSPGLPLLLTCSGTGGMEAALRNIVAKGKQVITVNAGKFGERWGHLCNALGIEVIEIKVEWGEVD